tara:strand:+ start:552 stop:701 length:150 start_codon:yes stop_codon:yes gene_type:complete
MKLDIKTVITLLGIAAMMGGFYYTTEMRLDSLESKVASLAKKINKAAKK